MAECAAGKGSDGIDRGTARLSPDRRAVPLCRRSTHYKKKVTLV